MSVALRLNPSDEVLALRVAREIAMNLHDIEDVLKNNDVAPAQWAELKDSPYFTTLLREQLANWNSALNTQERVKLKSAAIVEEWLPEADRMAHDPSQPLNQRVELMKLVKSFSTIGIPVGEGGGDRFSVTINLGQEQIKISKEVTPQVIEHEESNEPSKGPLR